MSCSYYHLKKHVVYFSVYIYMLSHQVENNKQDLNAASAQYAKFDEEKGSLNREARDAKRVLVTAEDKLGSLKGNREQVNAIQANRGKESLSIRQWLEVPQNKGRFKRPVHGPIALDVVVDR